MTTTDKEVRELIWHDWVKQEIFRLDFDCVRACGPAAQTYAALRLITGRETFIQQAELAKRARLPLATVRKHIKTLEDECFIDNKGRQKTRAGRPRRTCTLKVVKAEEPPSENAEDKRLLQYGILPWWACCWSSGFRFDKHRLPWRAKVLLSVVMARLASLLKAYEREAGIDPDDHDRWRFPLGQLQATTGLSRPSIIQAKRDLANSKLISWFGGEDPKFGTMTDVITPRFDTFVVVTSLANGRCTIDIRAG